MTQRNGWARSAGLTGLAVLALVAGALYTLYTAPAATLTTTAGGASLYMAADRDTVWLRNGCVAVEWEAEGVAAIFFNGAPTVGVWAGTACVEPARPPWARLILPDGAVHDLTLPVTVITETTGFQAGLGAALLLLSAALGLSPPIRRRWRAANTETRWHYVLVAAALLVGFGVRAVHLNGPMRGDESFTVMAFAEQPYSVIRADYRDVNNHILHTLLVRAARNTFGTAAAPARLPAFLAGLALLPLAYLVGRAYYGRQAALVGLALVAVHPYLINYSVNARGYSILAACFLLLMWAASAGRVSGWRAAALAVVPAVGFATVTVFLYPMLAAGVWWAAVLAQRETDRVRQLGLFVGSLAVGAGLTIWFYWPIIGEAGLAALTNSGYVVRLPLASAPAFVLGELAELGRLILRGFPLGWVVLAGLLAALVMEIRGGGYSRPPLLWTLGGALVLALAGLRYPLHTRAWLWALPPLLIGGAAGLVWLTGRLAAGAANVLAALALIAGLGWLAAADIVQTLDETGDANGAEAAALYFRELGAAQPTTEIMVIPQFTAQYALPFYFTHHRITPPPEVLDVAFGERTAEIAAQILAGEDVALFTLHPATDEDPVQYFVYEGPPQMQAALTSEIIAEYPAGWALRRFVPR